MTTLTSTPEFQAWAKTVRDLYINNTHPLTGDDDPRVKHVFVKHAHTSITWEQFLKEYVHNDTTGYIENKYFRDTVQIPEPTMLRPAWADTVTVSIHLYPEVDLHYRSCPIERAGVTVYWEAFNSVLIDEGTDHEGNPEPEGSWFQNEPFLVADHGGERVIDNALTMTQTNVLGQLLLQVADERINSKCRKPLMRRTGPGTPDTEGIGGGL